MKATFQSRLAGGVTVVDVSGRLTLGDPIQALEEALPKAGNVVLNLGKLEYMDSAGLGALLRASKIHSIKVVNLPRRIEDLLRLTGSYALIDVQPDEVTAITSFH